MSIERFFVRDATIDHPVMVEGYGNAEVPDYVNGSHTPAKCWLHRLDASQVQGTTRDAQVSTHVARFPLGTALAAIDRVTIDTQVFDVDGPPDTVWTPQGGHHVRALLHFADG